MMKWLLPFVFCMYYLANNAQVIENPVFDRTDMPSFHIDKVELIKDSAIVYCTYSAEAGMWANISPKTYLEDISRGTKYPLVNCSGLPFAPEKKSFPYVEKCSVRLSFPCSHNLIKFDIIENAQKRAFNIYGVCLNQQTEKKYQNSDFTRFLNMSSFYDSAGDSTKAIQYKIEEIEIAKYNYGIQSDVTFFSILGLCVLYDKYGFRKETMKLIEYLSKIQEEAWGDSDLKIVFKRAFTEKYLMVNYYDKVVETIKKAIEVYDRLNINDNVYALLLRNMADHYSTIGDEDNFEYEQKKCLEIRRKRGEEGPFLADLFILFMSNSNSNIYSRRLNIIEKEMDNLPTFVDTLSLNYFYFLSYIAPTYRMIGNPQKSIALSNQMLQILNINNNVGNFDLVVKVQEEKLQSLKALNRLHDVIDLGEKVKTMCDSLQIRPKQYKRIVEVIAESYNMLFDYEKAIPLMEQIIAMNEKDEDWLALTSSLFKTGNYCKNKRDLDEAEKYVKKALEVINHHDRLEEFLTKEIDSVDYDGNIDVILDNFFHSIVNNKIAIYGSLGFISSEKGKLEDAINYELNAGEAIKLLLDKRDSNKMSFYDDNIVYAYHLLSLSGYYSQNKQYDKSNACASESVEYFQKGNCSEYYRSYDQLAFNKYMENDIDSAIYYANKALLVSRSSDVEGSSSLCQLSLLYSCKDEYNKAEEYMSEALCLLQNKIKTEIVSMTNEQKQRLWNRNELYFLKYRDIVAKCERNGELLSKLLNYILFSKSLLLDTDNANDEMSYKRMQVLWKDVQKTLQDNDIAIEFFTTREKTNSKAYYALVIDKKSNYPNMIYLFSDSYFETRKRTSKQTDLDELGNLVWQPILTKYNQIQNIFFSPDGILHIIPIEYSKVDGIGEVMDYYNVYRLSSTKEIGNLNCQLIMSNAVLYGGLDYDMLAKEENSSKENKDILRSISVRGGFEPLNCTLDEIEEIGDLLNSKEISTVLYSGEKGTEDTFKDLSGKGVTMLHMSTHGMYVEPTNIEQKKQDLNFNFIELVRNDKDPVIEDIVLTHSFLVMSGGNKLTFRKSIGDGYNDGILTASEISHVDLSNVDIVILSACETGLGDIENGGVYGLQRGFKKAGVNTILMSLDKVDDEATKILMVEFYKNLMSGKTKHQSLKDAQKYLRQVENGKYDDPKYWASFILLDGLN